MKLVNRMGCIVQELELVGPPPPSIKVEIAQSDAIEFARRGVLMGDWTFQLGLVSEVDGGCAYYFEVG